MSIPWVQICCRKCDTSWSLQQLLWGVHPPGVIFLKMTPSGADLLRRKRRAAQFRAGCTDSQAEINFLGMFRERWGFFKKMATPGIEIFYRKKQNRSTPSRPPPHQGVWGGAWFSATELTAPAGPRHLHKKRARVWLQVRAAHPALGVHPCKMNKSNKIQKKTFSSRNRPRKEIWNSESEHSARDFAAHLFRKKSESWNPQNPRLTFLKILAPLPPGRERRLQKGSQNPIFFRKLSEMGPEWSSEALDKSGCVKIALRIQCNNSRSPKRA